MKRWLRERYAAPLLGVLLAGCLAALLVAGGIGWAEQHRAQELRLALAQAEASRLAGLLNALVARVDQAAITLTLSPALSDEADCDARVAHSAEAMQGALTGFAIEEGAGGIACESAAGLRSGGATAEPWAGVGQEPVTSFIMDGSAVLDPVILIRRVTQGGRTVLAGLRVEALRLAAGAAPAGALEDSRGTRLALGDGRLTHGLPAAYFPPPRSGVSAEGRRVISRIGDHLAITLDVEGGMPADARAAAMINAGWVFLALAGGLALTLLVLRLTLLRPLRRLGEQLDRETGTEGLVDWLSVHTDTPMRHLVEKIIRRELSQELRVTLREAMLREVNHRVAGHLQMVISMLRLQAREAGPPQVAEALRMAERRANTLALVHQGLQNARRDERLELLDLLRRVAVNLVEGSPAADFISLHVEGQAMIVPAETGLPVALVLTEWVSGALRHDEFSPVITIGLWHEGAGAVLDFQDGGHLPEGPDCEGLSPAIVEALCAQIGGRIENLKGVGCRLSFAVDAGP